MTIYSGRFVYVSEADKMRSRKMSSIIDNIFLIYKLRWYYDYRKNGYSEDKIEKSFVIN